jgi:hypothetical protein
MTMAVLTTMMTKKKPLHLRSWLTLVPGAAGCNRRHWQHSNTPGPPPPPAPEEEKEEEGPQFARSWRSLRRRRRTRAER